MPVLGLQSAAGSPFLSASINGSDCRAPERRHLCGFDTLDHEEYRSYYSMLEVVLFTKEYLAYRGLLRETSWKFTKLGFFFCLFFLFLLQVPTKIWFYLRERSIPSFFFSNM